MVVLLVGLAIVLLDQFTKHWVHTEFVYGESRPVIEGFFSLTYVRNDGAAWNILSGYGLILILISVAILILLLVYRRSFIEDKLSHKLLMGLMVGGIIGNLIDRIRYGWVIDFLDFQFGSYQYPSFNVADSAICIAVGVYIISNVLGKHGAEGIEQSDEKGNDQP